MRRLFGAGKAYDGWRRFAREAGGEFVDRGFIRPAPKDSAGWLLGSWVEIHFMVRGHPAVLETFDESVGKSGQSVERGTRLRVTLPFREPFCFEVSREGFLTRLGNLIGMQDLQVGHPDFDRAFLVKASDANAARSLLDDMGIRQRLLALAGGAFGLRPADDWGGSDASAELYFEEMGLIQEVERLTALSRLFDETVDRAERLGLLHGQ